MAEKISRPPKSLDKRISGKVYYLLEEKVPNSLPNDETNKISHMY